MSAGWPRASRSAGVRVDHGSHRLHPSAAPAVLRALSELLGGDLQRRTRNGRIRIVGNASSRSRPGPPTWSGISPRLHRAGSSRDAITRPLRRPRADTFAEVVRASLGPTLADHFYAPLCREDLGPRARAARRRARAATGELRVAHATCLPASCGRDGDASSCTRGGVSVRSPNGSRRPRVERGRDDPARGRGDARRPPGLHGVVVDGSRRLARRSRVDVLDAARVGAGADHWPRASARCRARPAASCVRGGSCSSISRSSDRASLEFDAHYFPEPDVASSRISEPKNYRDSADDPAGRHGPVCRAAGDRRRRALAVARRRSCRPRRR